jgi:hypothetical protein
MTRIIRLSFLALGGLLLAINPFSAKAQSYDQYGTGSAYTAPSYPSYPGYAVPYSGTYGYTHSAPGYGTYRSDRWQNPDWYGRRAWREHREHEWREHERREHERRERWGW